MALDSLGVLDALESVPEQLGFQNREMKKKALGELVFDAYRSTGLAPTVEFLDRLKDFGFFHATRGGISIGVEDLRIPDDKTSLLKEAEERVERFGRPTLIEQFDSLPIEDFQQEFELAYCDESYSFFPYELILPCTSDELVLADDFDEGDVRVIVLEGQPIHIQKQWYRILDAKTGCIDVRLDPAPARDVGRRAEPRRFHDAGHEPVRVLHKHRHGVDQRSHGDGDGVAGLACAVRLARAIDARRDGLSLRGFASLPTFHRGLADRQYLFVNGRPVREISAEQIPAYMRGSPLVLDVALGISHQGDAMARHYLYEAANVLLTTVRARSALKGWGLQIMKRRGPKRARRPSR